MNYLKHTFILNEGDPDSSYLNILHFCKFCGLYVQQIMRNINQTIDASKQLQTDYINEHTEIKCLTEEQWIIKQIIE